MSCEVGSQYRTSYVVLDANSDYITPTTITLTVILPDGTSSSLSPTEDSTGQYHYDYTFTVEGLHKFVWLTTGPVTHRTDYQNANEWRSMIGVSEAMDFINDQSAPVSTLRMIMASATELAESIAGACVQRTYTNESVPGCFKPVIQLPHAPLPGDDIDITITSVWGATPTWVNHYSVIPPATATVQLIVYPDSGTIEPLDRGGFWDGPWKATYTAGRRIIPYRIQLAVKEIVLDLWAIHRAYGADELEPGPEETARYEAMLAQYDMPPHAKQLLEIESLPGFGG